MNRLLTLVTASLLTVPATARAQARIEDLLKADAKHGTLHPSATIDLSDWGAYNRAGWRAINKGYYDTAEHEFLASIKAARRESVNDPRLLARSYADYAWALQRQGRNAEAEPLVKWALTVRETLLEPDAPAIVQGRNQLATLYYEIGRLAEAESLLRRAVEVQATAPRSDPQEHARTQTLLGLLLVAQRRYAEAESPFLKALQIREKARGPSHPETGDGLNNLAWAYHEQGKDDEARPHFERALKIFELSRGPLHPSVAHVLDGLAQIHAARGENDEAADKFRRSIAIWRKIPTAGALELVPVLRRYSRLLDAMGRESERKEIDGRIAVLPDKVTMTKGKAAPWYRFPEPSQGVAPGTARPQV